MLAIAGGKGGCGKTTTTLGLAAAHARRRRSVLVADADIEMPDLHLAAGVDRGPGLDDVGTSRSPGDVAQPHPTVSGLSVLPAAAAEDGRRRSGRNCSPLNRLRGTADAVLLDCPAGAGPDAVAPLRVADAAVVVTTLDPACLRDAAKTAAMARQVQTPVAGVLVSRADGAPDSVTELLDCPLLGAVPDAGRLGESLADEGVRAAYAEVVSALQPKCL